MSDNALTTTTQEATLSRPSPPTGFLAPLLPHTAKALAEAQQKSKAVPHDQRNAFHKYDYTSAEAIIAEAKEILGACGLSLLPLEQTVNGHDREGPDRFELVRKFLLLHSSGESVPIMLCWPIVPDKGRPLDKATGAAATTSLAYFLRDLLLMPRVDRADDVAGRDDRSREQSTPRQPSPPPRQDEPPRKVTAEELAELHALVDESGRKWTTWLRWLKDKGFPVTSSMSMADITVDAYERLLPSLRKAAAEKNPN
jgi:hypothetical protein